MSLARARPPIRTAAANAISAQRSKRRKRGIGREFLWCVIAGVEGAEYRGAADSTGCGTGARIGAQECGRGHGPVRSEEHTSELQSLMRISYAVFCLKKKKKTIKQHNNR